MQKVRELDNYEMAKAERVVSFSDGITDAYIAEVDMGHRGTMDRIAIEYIHNGEMYRTHVPVSLSGRISEDD